jgi:hypothetical protein
LSATIVDVILEFQEEGRFASYGIAKWAEYQMQAGRTK